MVVFAGRGDAGRSMALLWRTTEPHRTAEPRRGAGLSVDLIVDAAIELADAEGMAALSMRAVGDRLGCTAMALYTHVANKNELLDLMHDRVLGELTGEHGPDRGWRAAVTAWAGDACAFYLRHPWVLQVSQARPVLGPNEYGVLEAVVRILYATGLPAGVLRRLVGSLFHLVRATAQTIAESRQAANATGVGDAEWWSARSAMLLEVAPDFAERFPTVVRLETEGAVQPVDDGTPYLEREARETFDIGLTILLDGVEAAILRAGSAAG
ncbi:MULTISPECIES: TetR/AcrR family transcriptional regulator [Kitasatospora]|uniref:TetR/AcrR family transcriptional regulator C-terminal domain-containing protein n=1 Tax=Kitasatospora cystarginea TaxID=58350 RepID=A0ABP5RNZ8_9ACTN